MSKKNLNALFWHLDLPKSKCQNKFGKLLPKAIILVILTEHKKDLV